ncbi:MAG: NACHT domain-containing protein [Caldilineaceae bacterium]
MVIGKDIHIGGGAPQRPCEKELAYLNAGGKVCGLGGEIYTVGWHCRNCVRPRSMARLDLPTFFHAPGFEKLVEHGFGEQRRVERVPVEDLRTAVRQYRRLVLLGEPGAGKTTTLWRLFYDYAVAALNDETAPLPLLVPLGGYTGTELPLHYCQQHFGHLGDQLTDYLRNKRVILLLDALNEMPRQNYRERVQRIERLLSEYPDLSVVVTCRVLDYVETLTLEKLDVKPLDVARQREYLHHYLGEQHGEALFWQLAGDEVAELWQEWCARKKTWEDFWYGQKLPKNLRRHLSSSQRELWQLLHEQLPPLLDLGRNPFLLVMLAQVYARQGTMPQNRGHLLAAFVETLLAREEKRCESERWPGPETLYRGLGHLAYAMQELGERSTAVDVTWANQQLAAVVPDPAEILYLASGATLLGPVDISF